MLVIQFSLSLSAMPLVFAQSPESFFPVNLGDRWDYQDLSSGQISSQVLTRDSIALDGSRYLFYNNSSEPLYRIDSSINVVWGPMNPNFNYLRYRLAADSCEAWENSTIPSQRWAWVARIDSGNVFLHPSVIKTFKYAPGNPCGLGSLAEHRLATGFGLIYMWQEPNDITFLRGCIINGDTFGIVTSVPKTQELPHSYVLKQNYPNPFNPNTTIELIIPERAFVEISIYDLLGQHVVTIANEDLDAGIHSYSWNAIGFPSGIYFCRMGSPSAKATIKMLLTK